MSRFLHTLCASITVAVWLCSITPSAFAQGAHSTPAAFSVDQTRAAFANLGYLVGEPHIWDWMQPSFTAFRVSDPPTGRVLTVVVYASIDAADQARLEAAHGRTLDASSTDGPALVTGFGRSYWSGNVALMQSTESTLHQQYQLQEARDMCMNDDSTPVIELPLEKVDADFANALVAGAISI